jgi:hypothetical protein
MTPAEAEQVVKGMTAEGAARVVADLAISEGRTREERYFSLMREFALPHVDGTTGQVIPPAITDPLTLDRVIANTMGESIPEEEISFYATGTLYSLVAGGESPTDPEVINAVAEDMITKLDYRLTAGGQATVLQLTDAEKAALRKGVAEAARSDDIVGAAKIMSNYIKSAEELKDLRRKFSIIANADRVRDLRMTGDRAYLAERRRNEAIPPEAIVKPQQLGEGSAIVPANPPVLEGRQ